MVTRPQTFLKTHAIKRSFTLQGRLQIHKYSVLQSNLKVQLWRENKKGFFHTLGHVFYGWFKLVKNKKVRYKVMWFCHHDKTCCVLGDVQDSMKGKHQVPMVWLVFTNIRLIYMEVAFLEDVGFHLPLLIIMVGI
jgi:hypothetical protein